MAVENKIDYNLMIRELREALKEKDIERVKTNASRAHAAVHHKALTSNQDDTIETVSLLGLNDENFRSIPSKKYDAFRTVAFFVFHMTRIEDICANVLIANDEQIIFQDDWQQRMNIKRVDTGNSMTKEEMIEFAQAVNLEALFAYRLAVATKTQRIIDNLTVKDLQRKPTEKQLSEILESKSVLDHKDSRWLLDFWGNKNVGGLLLMPITRHQKVHLNDCMSIIQKGK